MRSVVCANQLNQRRVSVHSEHSWHSSDCLQFYQLVYGYNTGRKKAPEFLEEALDIVLVTGMQRTGTTKLQRMLSSQSSCRALYSWEALYPSPLSRSRESVDKRKSLARRNVNALKWLSPSFYHIHPVHPDAAEEDVLLLDLTFHSSSFEAIFHIPSYAEFLNSRDATEAYRFEETCLKLLQWQRGGGKWILKSPHHLEFLEEFHAVFPQSKIIRCQRNPVQSTASFLSMLYHARALFSDSPNIEEIKNHWVPKLGRMHAHGTAFAQRKGQDVMRTIDYVELSEKPREKFSEILDFLDINYSEKDIQIALLASDERYGSTEFKHVYHLTDFWVGGRRGLINISIDNT